MLSLTKAIFVEHIYLRFHHLQVHSSGQRGKETKAAKTKCVPTTKNKCLFKNDSKSPLQPSPETSSLSAFAQLPLFFEFSFVGSINSNSHQKRFTALLLSWLLTAPVVQQQGTQMMHNVYLVSHL